MGWQNITAKLTRLSWGRIQVTGIVVSHLFQQGLLPIVNRLAMDQKIAALLILRRSSFFFSSLLLFAVTAAPSQNHIT
jgi:hypothetical protein